MDEVRWYDKGLRFKCTGCGKCCTGGPGGVFVSITDMEKMAAHLTLSIEEFMREYTYTLDGKRLLIDRPNTLDCCFLEGTRCSIYEARPTQCRTFPWWLQYLKSPQDWQKAKERCEGIDHPEAPLVSSLYIEAECLTFLDNVIEQHFTL